MPDRLIIKLHARRPFGPIEIDSAMSGYESQFARIIEIGPPSDRFQPDGPIHRAGVEKIKRQPLGDRQRDARFSCACGTVNGDDHSRLFVIRASLAAVSRGEGRGEGTSVENDSIPRLIHCPSPPICSPGEGLSNEVPARRSRHCARSNCKILFPCHTFWSTAPAYQPAHWEHAGHRRWGIAWWPTPCSPGRRACNTVRSSLQNRGG